MQNLWNILLDIKFLTRDQKENHLSLSVKYSHCKRTIHIPLASHKTHTYIDLPILVIVVCSFFNVLKFIILHVCQKPNNWYYFVFVLFYFRKYLFCCIRTTVSNDYISHPVYYRSNSSLEKNRSLHFTTNCPTLISILINKRPVCCVFPCLFLTKTTRHVDIVFDLKSRVTSLVTFLLYTHTVGLITLKWHRVNFGSVLKWLIQIF